MKKEHDKKVNKKYGMAIDLDKCTGCGSCMVACMSENNVPFKEDESNKLDSITWMRVYKVSNKKSYPNNEVFYIPRPCQHCGGQHEGHSPCVSVCPATVTSINSLNTSVVISCSSAASNTPKRAKSYKTTKNNQQAIAIAIATERSLAIALIK